MHMHAQKHHPYNWKIIVNNIFVALQFYKYILTIIRSSESKNKSEFTSRDVPGAALSRRQWPDLGTVSPYVWKSHFVQIHREKLLVLPQVTKRMRGRERKDGRVSCV